MQEPFAGFAVNPAQGRIGKTGDEIVAPRLVAVPPAAFDTLGAGKQQEIVFAHRARRLEQPERAWAGMPELPRLPFAGLDAPPAVLWTMIGISRYSIDRVVSEARLQPLGKTRPAFVLGERVAEHSRGTRLQQRKIVGFEPNRFHRTRQRQRRKLLAQQLPQARGFARRRCQADFYRSRFPFWVEQEIRKGADPGMARRKQAFKLNQQPPRSK